MAAVDAAVGAGVGVTCVAVSVALQMIARAGGSRGGGGGKHHGHGKSGSGGKGGGLAAKLENPLLHVVLWIVGGVGLVGTQLGSWINTAVTWGNNQVAALMTEWIGTGLGWLVSLALVVFLIKDVRGKKAGPRTLGIAAASPFAVVAIPGTVGSAAAAVIAFVSAGVGSIVGALFGL